jgi:hypothetical protein
MALRTLVPIAALIPCLMLVTALLIAQSLRPMVRLASDLDARRADDMSRACRASCIHSSPLSMDLVRECG